MDVDRARAMAAIRKMGYNLLVLIPACFPALGCSKAPETPPEVKKEAVDPETDPIDKMVEIPDDIRDLQEVDPPKSNDSPDEPGKPAGQPNAKEK